MLARQGRSAQKVVQDRCCSYSLACLFRDRRVLSGWVLVYGLSPSSRKLPLLRKLPLGFLILKIMLENDGAKEFG